MCGERVVVALLEVSQRVVVRFFERIQSSEKAVNYSEDRQTFYSSGYCKNLGREKRKELE